MAESLPVYLVHWNAPDWIASSVRSICESDIPVSITVVDNGPEEATSALTLPASVRVLNSGGNLGYAGGANVGLTDWLVGGAEWCVLGAHDLHVSTTALRMMFEAASDAPSFGIIGPGTDTDDYWAGRPLGISEGIEERTSMSGTCLLLRRQCILDIGLIDPQFGSYGEDDELCDRARRNGWKVGRIPDAMATGIGSISPRKTKLRMRNIVLLAIKTKGRLAGLRIVLQHVRVLIRSILRSFLPGEDGIRARKTVSDRWYGLRHGFPLLWSRMDPPPTWTPESR